MDVERPADKYLLRTNSKVRPYMCGFEGCGKTYKESSHLRQHVFEHTKISEHGCTYPECGPERYFCTNTELQRHIDRAHRPKQETPRSVQSAIEYLRIQQCYVPILIMSALYIPSSNGFGRLKNFSGVHLLSKEKYGLPCSIGEELL